MRINKHMSRLIISPVFMAFLVTAQAQTISVNAEEYGDKWPFTVDSVVLSCRNVAAVLMQTNSGATYWLNGKASAQFKQFPSWREIAKPDPRYGAGAVMTPPSDMIKRGLDLCRR